MCVAGAHVMPRPSAGTAAACQSEFLPIMLNVCNPALCTAGVGAQSEEGAADAGDVQSGSVPFHA